MRFLTRFIAPIVLFALTTAASKATTYYVSQSAGLDSNDGLSQVAPFQTLAKVNSLTNLKGGDSILLRQGDVWHESLVIPASGTSTSLRLTVSSYGMATAKPIIDGADPVTGWSLVSAGTYQVRRTTPAYKVFVDAIYTQTTPLTQVGSVADATNTPGSFFSDSDTLYIHLADGSDPSGHTIEVSGNTHPMGIVAANKSYVSIQNLEIIRTTNSGVAFVLEYPNASGSEPNQYNYLGYLTIFNTGSTASMPYGFDGAIMVRGNASQSSRALKGWQISKNMIGRLDSRVGLNYNIGGIQLRGLTGAVIKNNQIRTVTAMGFQDRPYGAQLSSGSNIIDSNSFSDNEGNISAECPYEQVTNNKVVNSRGFGLQVQSYGYAANNLIAHLGLSTDGTLYNGIDGYGGAYARYVNNTVMDVYACTITVEGQATGVSVEGGTYDSNNASGCATYVTASTQSVNFTGDINWKLNPNVPKPFGYLVQNAGDSAHRYSYAQFKQVAK